jgi:hypothetical protein
MQDLTNSYLKSATKTRRFSVVGKKKRPKGTGSSSRRSSKPLLGPNDAGWVQEFGGVKKVQAKKMETFEGEDTRH